MNDPTTNNTFAINVNIAAHLLAANAA